MRAFFLIPTLLFLLPVLSVSAQVSPTPTATPSPSVAAPAAPAAPTPRLYTYNSVHVGGPFIALTFDDGPHATLTPKLLDLLARHKAKATFFVVGQNAAEYPAIVRRMAREGHEVANHSWSHPNLGKMSDEAVRQQLKKTDDAIKAATGLRPTLMRPPYGSITTRQKRWFHEEFGYSTILWDVDPLDWRRPGAGVVTSRIVNGTRQGSIILVHDIHPPSVEAMSATLSQLESKGFKFVTVSELLAMEQPAPPKAVPVSPVPKAEPAAAAAPPAPPPSGRAFSRAT